jgi:hypothetical protein
MDRRVCIVRDDGLRALPEWRAPDQTPKDVMAVRVEGAMLIVELRDGTILQRSPDDDEWSAP